MFEKIPASTPEATDPLLYPQRARLPAFAPIVLKPSRYLWHWQWMLHLLLATALLGALWPHLSRQLSWWLLLVVALAGLLLSVLACYRGLGRGNTLLEYDNGWYLEASEGRQALQPAGEWVVWQWLIVLHFRPLGRKRRITLVLLPDSATSEEQRRLRVWLRTLHGQSLARSPY